MRTVSHGDMGSHVNIGDMVVSKDVDGKLYLYEVCGGYGTLRENGISFHGVPLVDVDAAEALNVENEIIDAEDAHCDGEWMDGYITYDDSQDEHDADCRAACY